LVLSAVAGEQGPVGGEGGCWAVELELVLRPGPFQLVRTRLVEVLEVDAAEVEVVALQRSGLLGPHHHDILGFLETEESLVDGGLAEVGPDDIQLAEVPPAGAVIAKTGVLVVVAEVQLVKGSVELVEVRAILVLSSWASSGIVKIVMYFLRVRDGHANGRLLLSLRQRLPVSRLVLHLKFILEAVLDPIELPIVSSLHK
jgi:hypothetical protein